MNIPEKLPASIDHAIENLAAPLSKTVGETLGSMWFLIFGGVIQCAEKRKLKFSYDLSLFKETLEEKINSISSENRIEPDFQTAAQALEASKFCIEHEELRNMFANLIASSMNSDKTRNIHPSFPDIIKQMSPLDARNFMCFTDTLPTIEFIIKENDTDGYDVLLSCVFLDNPNESDVLMQSKSLSSLSRLGLINIDYLTAIIDAKVYEKFNDIELEAIGFKIKPGVKTSFNKGIAQITPIGKDFMSVCLT